MHLNSLFPEKDKDTDLWTKTVKMNNSLVGLFLISITKLRCFAKITQLLANK